MWKERIGKYGGDQNSTSYSDQPKNTVTNGVCMYFSPAVFREDKISNCFFLYFFIRWKYFSCSLCAIQMQGAHAFTGAVLIDVLKCSHMKHIVN